MLDFLVHHCSGQSCVWVCVCVCWQKQVCRLSDLVRCVGSPDLRFCSLWSVWTSQWHQKLLERFDLFNDLMVSVLRCSPINDWQGRWVICGWTLNSASALWELFQSHYCELRSTCCSGHLHLSAAEWSSCLFPIFPGSSSNTLIFSLLCSSFLVLPAGFCLQVSQTWLLPVTWLSLSLSPQGSEEWAPALPPPPRAKVQQVLVTRTNRCFFLDGDRRRCVLHKTMCVLNVHL